jgi:biopolymer transport protein TolR
MVAQSRVYLDEEELSAVGRHERFQELARESTTGEVFVRGDQNVVYGRMMELMAELGQAGFARVTLVTDVRLGPAGAERALVGGEAQTDSPQEPTAAPSEAPPALKP